MAKPLGAADSASGRENKAGHKPRKERHLDKPRKKARKEKRPKAEKKEKKLKKEKKEKKKHKKHKRRSSSSSSGSYGKPPPAEYWQQRSADAARAAVGEQREARIDEGGAVITPCPALFYMGNPLDDSRWQSRMNAPTSSRRALPPH
jgi:hypothetical protein